MASFSQLRSKSENLSKHHYTQCFVRVGRSGQHSNSARESCKKQRGKRTRKKAVCARDFDAKTVFFDPLDQPRSLRGTPKRPSGSASGHVRASRDVSSHLVLSSPRRRRRRGASRGVSGRPGSRDHVQCQARGVHPPLRMGLRGKPIQAANLEKEREGQENPEKEREDTPRDA